MIRVWSSSIQSEKPKNNRSPVKEYLEQAFYLDKRISSKLEQIARLEELATRATSTTTAARVSGTAEHSRLESTVSRIVDLQDEINADIDQMVDVKREIAKTISKLQNPTYRLVLENRYLNLLTWEQIAGKMNYTYRNITYLHRNALQAINSFLVFPKKI